METLTRPSNYYAALVRTHQAFVAPTEGQLLNYVARIPLGEVFRIVVMFHGSEIFLRQVLLPKSQ